MRAGAVVGTPDPRTRVEQLMPGPMCVHRRGLGKEERGSVQPVAKGVRLDLSEPPGAVRIGTIEGQAVIERKAGHRASGTHLK